MRFSKISPLHLIPFCFAWLLALAGATARADAYLDAEALEARLRSLAREHESLMRLRPLAESREGRTIWRAELGAGSDEARRERPAILVAAGLEGNDLIGSASALAWIERLLGGYAGDESIRELLDTTTIHVFPRMNPDAAENFFASPPIETARNGAPTDDDHDGRIDEDGPEDLDGDGRIARMRVEDPEGEYLIDPADARVMFKADALKGERGEWLLLVEGIDNDGDEAWNEDGPGGVNFNRHFPYAYPWFAADAGVYALRQPAARALADFVAAHPNVAVAVAFGAADNLLGSPKDQPKTDTGKPAEGVHADDLPYYREFGKIYREALGLEKEMKGASRPGAFSDWMYFHRGRLSLALRPWSPELQLAINKARKQKEEKKKEEETEEDASDAEETNSQNENEDGEKENEESTEKEEEGEERTKERREFLDWLAERDPEAFVPWQTFDHPDFPDRRVEIGGLTAFAETNPPASALGGLTARHADFLTTVALRLPRIAIAETEARHLGDSVFEVRVRVENAGFLPTALAHGKVTGEVFPTRLVLDLDDAAFLSGERRTFLDPLTGSGGSQETRWLLYLPDRDEIEVEAISMTAGRTRATIALDRSPPETESGGKP